MTDSEREAQIQDRVTAEMRFAAIDYWLSLHPEGLIPIGEINGIIYAALGAERLLDEERAEIAEWQQKAIISHALLKQRDTEIARLTAPPNGAAPSIREPATSYRSEFILDLVDEIYTQSILPSTGAALMEKFAQDVEREAHNAAIEAAALICDDAMDKAADREYHDLAQQASDCADAIRALKPL